MTFSEAYDKLYPRDEAEPEKSAEDEKMVETEADGTGNDSTDEGNQ